METLLKNWDVMRLVRLVAGILIIGSALVDRQPLLGLMGGILLLQSLLNVGCSAAGCGMPRQTHSTDVKADKTLDEIPYEEVH
ncbi:MULTISPECIES: hypothetical protein [unclassified Spirosoma]|uniref:hypothetical protein n=1 Tax=unclassified Spirosoma TaxID=2621999 RepID=UPI0009679499|nr:MULTISPECIES: hypothetical protein [unclassified Spirosoma]MBN8824204.1 hypothetical protein [Spirosoma sp.]OJW78939.1 MAG: hypothetical protein BGO59_10760 [Spirosoma sp. 48-14]